MEAGLYPEFDFTVDQSLFAEARRSKRGVGFLYLRDKAPIPTSRSFWIWDPRSRNTTNLCICFIDGRWMESGAWVLPQMGESPLFTYNIGKEAATFATNSSIQTLGAARSSGPHRPRPRMARERERIQGVPHVGGPQRGNGSWAYTTTC
ncbi:hypothetical protein B0T14DRAFT_4657 [Immersiella caudata]|uniref:Uncharacterized protein n=1 Tax=Immersiella caudata TaxID=314043 RepID=A0AA40CBK4_9PEZI|nr:hypothetical protein B0T14DRAFT_4657 [Immersiella caudata]